MNPQEYELYLKQESENIRNYVETIYKLKVPEPIPPTKEELTFWKIAGLEASIFVLSGLGAAVLSAIRTGGLFYIIEVLLVQKYNLPTALGTTFGVVALVTSLLAFEGNLIGVGLVTGKKSGKIEVSNVSLWTCLITVILASVFSSFSLVEVSDNAETFMNIVMAILTGLAASIGAFLSFENVGFVWNSVVQKREELLNNFSEKHKEWTEKGIQSYTSYSRTAKKQMGDMVLQMPTTNQETNKKKSSSEKAFDFITEYYHKNNDLPVIKKIAEGAEISAGTAFTALNDFILDHEEELLLKNLTTPEKIEKIKAKKFGGRTNTNEQMTTFIQNNGVFPTAEQISQMGLPLNEVASYVVENQDIIREKGLLDEANIQSAIDSLK